MSLGEGFAWMDDMLDRMGSVTPGLAVTQPPAVAAHETSNDSVSLGEVVSISKQKRSEILAKAARRMRERGSNLSDGKICR